MTGPRSLEYEPFHCNKWDVVLVFRADGEKRRENMRDSILNASTRFFSRHFHPISFVRHRAMYIHTIPAVVSGPGMKDRDR
jgi:hypothetical protein